MALPDRGFGREIRSINVASEQMVRTRPPSRTKRWSDAVAKAREIYDALDALYGDLESAFTDLIALQSEYEDWQASLPENLQQSPIAEKLQAIVDVEFPDDPRFEPFERIDELISEVEGADLPRGFGRD